MSEVIYKYDVPVDDQSHEVGFYPVHIECQHDYSTVQVWSLVDPDRVNTIKVRVFGTGHPVPAGAEYIGTTLTPSRELVWHVFDVSGVKDG